MKALGFEVLGNRLGNFFLKPQPVPERDYVVAEPLVCGL